MESFIYFKKLSVYYKQHANTEQFVNLHDLTIIRDKVQASVTEMLTRC